MTIIVGDIHGELEIVKDLLQDKNQSIVWTGDFVDSFKKNISEQIEILDLILEALETRDNVTVLVANHEYSYINERFRASGFTYEMAYAMAERKPRILRSFKWYTVVHGYLVTHAGASALWLPQKTMDRNEIVDFIEKAPVDKLAQIGWARGGDSPVGGILWCDTDEFRPVPGVKQVFGHSNWRNPTQSPGIWEIFPDNFNIDCFPREREVLELSELGAKIITF